MFARFRLAELSRRARLTRLLRLQALYAFFATLHWALAYRFMAFELALPIETVLAVSVMIYVAATALCLSLRRLEYRKALRWGLLFRTLTIFPYAFWPTQWGLLLGSVFFGMALVLFWVPYNLMFFEHRARTPSAGLSAVYAAIVPFVDVIGALAAGVVAVRYGYPALFVAAIAFALLPLALSLRLTPREPEPVSSLGSLSRIRGLRSLILLDGVAQGAIWPSVPIITLFVIEGTIAYASFFALLGLIGAGAALFLGAWSDRRARRVRFVVPFSVLFAVANLASVFAFSALAWTVWRSIATMSMALFDPFKNAVLLDQANDVVDLYVARELLLNVGRVLGVTATLVFFHFGALRYVLVLPVIIGLAYPLMIVARNMYPEERFFLKPMRAFWRQ